MIWERLCRLTRTIQRDITIVVTTHLRFQVSFSTSLLIILTSESRAFPAVLIKKTVFEKEVCVEVVNQLPNDVEEEYDHRCKRNFHVPYTSYLLIDTTVRNPYCLKSKSSIPNVTKRSLSGIPLWIYCAKLEIHIIAGVRRVSERGLFCLDG